MESTSNFVKPLPFCSPSSILHTCTRMLHGCSGYIHNVGVLVYRHGMHVPVVCMYMGPGVLVVYMRGTSGMHVGLLRAAGGEGT